MYILYNTIVVRYLIRNYILCLTNISWPYSPVICEEGDITTHPARPIARKNALYQPSDARLY